MKKNFFKALALASFLLVGGNASAQSTEGIPPLDPEYAQMADEIVAQQLNDPDEANKIFTKLLRKIRNNKEALLSAGSYFMTKNVYPCANMCSKQLYELAPDYIPGLMFSGEVAMMRKDYGGAGQKFDEVLMIDSTYVPALKLNARVYKNVNPHVAVEMLERIKRIEPNNYAADKDLGDIAYNLSEYKKAVKSYDEYYKAVPKTAEALDLRSCENYLQSLYATQNFEKASAVVNEVEKFDEKDMVFKRMKFFCGLENAVNSLNYEAEMEKCKEYMGYISNKDYADSLYIYLDYAYAGNLAKETGDIPTAISYYEQALKTDSTKTAGYKELANLMNRNGQATSAIPIYRKYISMLGEKADLSDAFGLGRLYAAASQQKDLTPEQKAAYVAEGDAVFAEIGEKKPDNYLAPYMRARINNVDYTKPNETVKKYYEKAIELMGDDESVNSQKLEAYKYLIFYGVQTDDLDLVRKAADAAAVISPDDTIVKNAITYLKSMNK